jgi:hypothetical protein
VRPFEFNERFLVETDVVDVLDEKFAFGETVLNRVGGKPLIVLATREPLLRCSGDDLTVAHEARRRVVVKGGNAEDVHDRF